MKHRRVGRYFVFMIVLIMCLSMLFSAIPVAFAKGEDSELLDGWTIGEGYSVTSTWVHEGSYALEHTGTASDAVSEAMELEKDITYYVTAYVRPETADSKIKISFAGQTMESESSGKWEELSAIVLGDGSKQKITITAIGDAQIDGISVRPFKEGEDLLGATFDNSNAPFMGEWLAEFEGHDGVVKLTGTDVTTASVNVSVDPNSFYLYSADFYLEENPPWIYIDMNDAVNEVQVRGTKIGEWHNVTGIWSSGSNSSTPLRLVKENNGDNCSGGANVTGAAYVDNISFKKVTLYEDLITDEGFEKGGAAGWEYVNDDNTDLIEYGEQTGPSQPGAAGGNYYGGNETHIKDYASFTFTGTGIKWISVTNNDCGTSEVWLDGEKVKDVSHVSPSLIAGQTLFEATGLEAKEHTIEIKRVEGIVPNDAFAYLPVSSSTEELGWKLGDGASQQQGSYYLFGANSLKLVDNAYAIANNGNTIQVEPNCFYYYSAWRLRPGNRDVDGSIVIKSADGTKLASITGTRYNQTLWNPEDADPNNASESKTGHWEQIFGFWFSGDHTEVTLWAESEGKGTIYFDDVTFNQYENRAAQNNIFKDGDMEGYIPDAEDLNPSDSEKARVKEQYEDFLADDLANFPASFKIGEDSYTGFGKDFTKKSQDTEAVDGGTKTITVLAHKSGLEFTIESVLYPDYNAYDWTIYIANNGKDNSPVVSNLNAADMTFQGEAPVLRGSVGDNAGWEPYIVNVEGKVTKQPTNGRGTQGDSSYFNFTYGDKGVLYAVGWPGQWTMSLDNSKNAEETRLTAGQKTFNAYIAPGETVRSPLMAFVHYNGRNLERATNLWRHWYIDCNMNRVTEYGEMDGERSLPEGFVTAGCSMQFHEMTLATDQGVIDLLSYYVENDIDIDYMWMDAGWYYMLDENGEFQSVPDWQWQNTGTWVVDESRFPSKMADISKYAAEHGIKTLLWFEPERVINPSTLRTDGKTVHPDWVLSDYLVDMGRPEAVEWTLERILTVLKEGGISLYREDFNCDPLPAWTNADAQKDSNGNRKGITENLYIQGHLELWDGILEAVPHATIDSCASGGNRNDLETIRRGFPLHKTDNQYANRTYQQAYATDMARFIPFFGTKADGDRTPGNSTSQANRYSLRTANVACMVVNYNCLDSPIDWDIVDDIVQEHKLVKDLIYSDYYVLENWSHNESDWAAWEYYEPETGEGIVQVFRRTNGNGTETYRLRGLEKETEYKIWFEDQNKPVVRTGLDLMKNGVEFNLPSIESSDILHIQKADAADPDRALIANITEVSIDGQYAGKINTAAKEGYDRFDIRFNMALRDTVLGVKEGKLEENVTKDYADIITINGKTVADLLEEDSEAVIMDYDVVNNILNVYVKSGIMDKTADIEVMLSKNLVSDGNGKIEGKTTFTYSAANDEWTKQTVVEHVPVESVTVSGNKVMYIDATQKLTARVLPDDADNKNVTWSSEDDKIATVDAEGNVTAVAEGNVKIYATATDGSGASDYIEITVVQVPAIPVESITVAGKDEMKVGESQKLTATVLPDNADNKGVMWETEDPVIALVDEDGTVTAVSEGTVKIYATAADGSNVYGYIEINVAADGEPVKPGEPTDEPSDKPTEPSDKPTDPDAPKTGDEANIFLWIVLGLMGAAGAAAVVVFVRKRRHN